MVVNEANSALRENCGEIDRRARCMSLRFAFVLISWENRILIREPGKMFRRLTFPIL